MDSFFEVFYVFVEIFLVLMVIFLVLVLVVGIIAGIVWVIKKLKTRDIHEEDVWAEVTSKEKIA